MEKHKFESFSYYAMRYRNNILMIDVEMNKFTRFSYNFTKAGKTCTPQSV